MGVHHFDITRREHYGRFDDVDVERIHANARCAVDPAAPANQGIVDLAEAARGDDGLVHFSAEVVLLRPTDTDRSGRRLLLEVPNRGRRTALGVFNRAARPLEPTDEIAPGDGFLFRTGWTVGFCAWQWDVPPSVDRMGFEAPVVVDADGHPVSDWIQLRLLLDRHRATVPLTDHHVGEVGLHRTNPTDDVDDAEARLLVRDRYWDEPVELPRASWRFDGPEHVALDGGFEPGRIYDLVYRAAECPVAGTGLLAIRDVASFLRRATDGNPLAAEIDHVIAFGQSQCGRFLRTFLHLGLNSTEEGGPAFDGIHAHIAGGRRGEFNHRLAQPSVQPTPGVGHRFPFADDAQVDPATGTTDGLLERQRRRGDVPRVMYTNTSSEYWRGDASLAHTSAADGSDVEPPAETRHYLFASTQHGPGMLPLTDKSILGSRGGNCFNIVDYTPLMRAAITNLAAWVEDGSEPPPNAVPRRADGTAVTRADVLAALAESGLELPDPDALNTIRPLDVSTYPARPDGPAYPSLVSAVDETGNEVAGIRLPDVGVPVAAHTGWSPRHADSGGSHLLLEYLGSTIPYSADAIAARYADEDDYLRQVRAAAEDLVTRRYLLGDDVALCVRIAQKRYQAITAS